MRYPTCNVGLVSITTIVLVGFSLVVGPLLFRAWLRRGVNHLERLELLPGETVLGDVAIELSEMPRRRAVYTSLAFMRGHARITTARVILCQPALGSSTLIMRYVVHREGSFESSWADGIVTFVVDREKSGMGERSGQRELRLVSRDDSPSAPTFVAVRAAELEKIAAALGIADREASVS